MLKVKRGGSGYLLWWNGLTLKISQKCYKRWGGDKGDLLAVIKNHYRQNYGIIIMKNLAIKPVSMTSLEISELTGSRHDNVKASIETLAKKGIIDLPDKKEGSMVRSNGRKMKTTLYTFTGNKGKRDCFIIVAQFSPKFVAAVVDRWLELEIKEAARQEKALARRRSSDLYLEQSAVIDSVLREDGKEVKPYHFSNEADMINRIVLGRTAAKYREFNDLSKDSPIRNLIPKIELDVIADLEGINISLIKLGVGYKERKAKLEAHYMKKHNQKLIDAYTKSDDLV